MRTSHSRKSRHHKPSHHEKALYTIEPNFPPGKLPGAPEFTDKYERQVRGPWNQGEQWEYVSEREAQAAVDGGDGTADVALEGAEAEASLALAARTASATDVDPTTGADLGAGPGAGSTKDNVAVRH
jgi:Mn-containing catalase